MRRGTKRKCPGQPTAYRPEFDEQAYRFCLLGLVDKEIASKFGVTERTLNNWKRSFPLFFQSLKNGRESADSNVTASLYQRAVGYSHPSVKIFADAKTGAHVEVPFIEHYPPDPVACIFWLKNRQPERWRDKQPETTVNLNQTVQIPSEVVTRAKAVVKTEAERH